MNKSMLRIVAIASAVAIFFSVSVFPASAAGEYLVPSENYPYAESLIYGADTIVVDMNYSSSYLTTRFYRYQMSAGSKFYCNVVENSNGSYSYILWLFSNSPIYTYTVNVNNGLTSDVKTWSKGSIGSWSYYWYDKVTFSGQDVIFRATQLYEMPSDISTDTDLVTNEIRFYPTVSYVQNNENYSKLSAQIDEGFTMLDERLSEGFNLVENAITNAAGEILNAGSDQPTLDTATDWFDDSITKVNEWLNSMSEFNNQLESDKAENASNMAQAGNLIKGFFDKVPSIIIAGCTFVAIMIVVVKAIGR